MKRAPLFTLFEQARQLTGPQDYVVLGSLATLGTQDGPDLPAEMAMPTDIDCYPLPDGWEHRMGLLAQDGLRIWFLDPDDTAISKYARTRPTICAGYEPGCCRA